MALEINVSEELSPSGVALQGYLRVMSVAFTREPMLRIIVNVWKDRASRDYGGKEPLATLHLALPPFEDGACSQAAIYTYLKTLPAFANAVDV